MSPAATTPRSPHVRLEHSWINEWLPKIGQSAFAVYVVLLKRKASKDFARAAHEWIATDTGLSVSTVKRALKTLLKFGLIFWKHRFAASKKGKSEQKANDYFFGQNDPPPQAKMTDTIITETSSLSEAAVASEALTAPETNELRSYGVRPGALAQFVKLHPAACRHALAVITFKSKWFSRIKPEKRGAAVAHIIKNPDRYLLDPKPPVPPLTPDDAAFASAMPSNRKEETTAALADPAFPEILAMWQAMNGYQRQSFVRSFEIRGDGIWLQMKEVLSNRIDTTVTPE